LIGKKILLGVASGWDSRKGLGDIVELSKVTDSQVIIVGVKEEQKQSLPGTIIAYVRTNNVGELQKLYAVADYYINPTYEDNFPTTNIEALACGTPVITYQTGGSIEASNAATGIVIKKGAYQDLDAKTVFAEASCCDRCLLFTEEEMLKEYLPLY